MLVEHKIGGVPVVEVEGKLIGMIGDGDLLITIRSKDTVVYDYYNLMSYTYEKREH
jgi:CBS domain-containing protein